MEFVGADADFRAEAKLAAVVESGAGVDHYGRAIDAGGKLAGSFVVGRDDRIGVFRTVSVDVFNGFVCRADDARRNDRTQELGRIIFFAGRLGLRDQFAGAVVAADLDALGGQFATDRRQELTGYVSVYDK